MRSASIIYYAFFLVFSFFSNVNIFELFIMYLLKLTLSKLAFCTMIVRALVIDKTNLLIYQCLTHFVAISHKVVRQFPRIFLGYEIFHIHNFLSISLFFSFLYHVIIDLNIVHNLLILVDRGGLVRGKTDFPVDYEVILIDSFFHVLYRIFNQVSKSYHRNFKNWDWVYHLFVHLNHVLPVCEASHNKHFLSSIIPCYSN